jgi:isoleucyl-tRNA synthetase
VRWAAPVLVFTAEEVWMTRHPEAGSVHLLEWPNLPNIDENERLIGKWGRFRELRSMVSEAVEPLRREKIVGSSLEANVQLYIDESERTSIDLPEFAEICIVSKVFWSAITYNQDQVSSVVKNTEQKCGRCWRHLPEVVEDGDLCDRCTEVVGELA